MKLEIIIGLEIHLQIKTKSKMFCSCANVSEEVEPNTNICPICLGHPGTLPVVNKEAVRLGVMMSLALDCRINKQSEWARKNYFYPDLAKGYQITQFEEPLAEDGHLTITTKEGLRRINITRLHLEEDAAKNLHFKDKTLLDFNRAGTPLIEIVTEPDFRTPQETKIFLQELRLLARYLKVSAAEMEKGQLRCDANISLKTAGEDKLYPKTEIKNLNSFRAVEKALEYEVKRQTDLWQKNTPVKEQSTRGWDEQKQQTMEQRDKEESADYRYFPEPDLLPLEFTQSQVKEIKARLVELPWDKRERLQEEYALTDINAKIITGDPQVANYFEKVMMESRTWLESLESVVGDSDQIWEQNKKRLSKLVNGWLTSELFKLMNLADQSITEIRITPENFAEFISLIYEGRINSSAAQVVLKEMFKTGKDPSDIMEDKNLGQVDDLSQLSEVVDQILKKYPAEAESYKKGKTVLIKFFIGAVMKETKGKANPQRVEEILKEKLG
ncbi:Asp-tRNA(Asn)/Glu-tRNA(Gln) amidotransferase subunit GatB [Patescibacteria group bacterium]|nr:Asp-tRNA(Asn)/Glu-tRNA(Gln) amidotransferase subunit GatB [Patescibacteria group bacterium]